MPRLVTKAMTITKALKSENIVIIMSGLWVESLVCWFDRWCWVASLVMFGCAMEAVLGGGSEVCGFVRGLNTGEESQGGRAALRSPLPQALVSS